jgi:hypothetical protein
MGFQQSGCEQESETIAAGHGAHVRGKVPVEALPHRVLLHLQLPQQALQAAISRALLQMSA